MINNLILCLLIVLCGGCNSTSTEESTTPSALIETPSSDTNWSAENKASAIQSCMQPGNPSSYCECFVSILETVFTHDEFVEFDAMLTSGTRPPDEVVSKLIALGNRSREECQLPNPTK
tara:strand:- start:966 stop:1322 length:357 start_codon:yes stop_codon:yes gene_type:complete